jgi:Tol biopolymer transport system component
MSNKQWKKAFFIPHPATSASLIFLLFFLLAACDSKTVQPNSAGNQTGGNFPTPVMGEDGQITVVAPTANPTNFSGTFYYVKQNNIWQSSSPFKGDTLGGVSLTKTKDLEVVKNPALSPDGNTLAYTFSPEPKPDPVRGSIVTQQINLLDIKSKQTKTLIVPPQTDTLLDEAAWSKDGKFIYYGLRQPLRDKEGVITGQKLEIRRYELATNKDEFIVSDATSPAPTADGKKLVYIGKDVTNFTFEQSLKVLDLSSREVKTLIGQEQAFLGYYFARPSPDGAWVVFSAPAQISEKLPTPKAVLDGQGSVRLLSVPKHSIPYDVYVIRTDGTGLRRLSALYEDQPQPLWSKDSKSVIFLAGHGLYTVDIANSLLSKKVNEGAYGGFDFRE